MRFLLQKKSTKIGHVLPTKIGLVLKNRARSHKVYGVATTRRQVCGFFCNRSLQK